MEMKNKLPKIYLTYYNLLIGQGLWKVYQIIKDYQILLIIFLKELIERLLNETCGIKHKSCDCFLKCKSIKYDLIEYKYFCCNKNTSLMNR